MNKADYIYRTKKKLERMKRTIGDIEGGITNDSCDPIFVKIEINIISELCDSVKADMANIYLLSEEKK